ncbi:hypothetical protein LBBP_02016 [Leptospira borgpetersenii serovar Ballum]|uniref:Uncharacterized protein n=1 Tax=Leptospira borgpetersenii serovar Ballum TaxID=280505 RepID=A0A0S2IS32_LEPBO|nr:hypothetical protein LBBP_02016 [Leptospira borgpetersenii serovar Ballum]
MGPSLFHGGLSEEIQVIVGIESIISQVQRAIKSIERPVGSHNLTHKLRRLLGS